MGRHGLFVVPPYGSYVFLGTILTDLEVTPTAPAEGSPCPADCRACFKACPTGALTEQGCDVSRCLSEVTQRKGDLTEPEAAHIKKSPTVWGCDLCQRACPLNRTAALSPLPEFREDLLDSLRLADLEGLSNKAFRRKYENRAFAWRGIGPLLRNLRLKNE
jgi:epoxyqueuosine reductase